MELINNQPKSQNRLTYIDSWRVIAVALVIVSHLSYWGNADFHFLIFNSRLHFPVYYGTVGVLIFFFISGFVVSKTCLDELRLSGSFSVKAFYIRRVFRI